LRPLPDCTIALPHHPHVFCLAFSSLPVML
jgi:hypothetical protein